MGLLQLYDTFNDSVLKRVEGLMVAGALVGSLFAADNAIDANANAAAANDRAATLLTENEELRQTLSSVQADLGSMRDQFLGLSGAAIEQGREAVGGAIEAGREVIEDIDTDAALDNAGEALEGARETGADLVDDALEGIGNFFGGDDTEADIEETAPAGPGE